jgi:hypothetical protein
MALSAVLLIIVSCLLVGGTLMLFNAMSEAPSFDPPEEDRTVALFAEPMETPAAAPDPGLAQAPASSEATTPVVMKQIESYLLRETRLAKAFLNSPSSATLWVS